MGFGFRSKKLLKFSRPTAFASDPRPGNQGLASQRQKDGQVARCRMHSGAVLLTSPRGGPGANLGAPQGCPSPRTRILHPRSEGLAELCPGSHHSSLHLHSQHSSQIQENLGWLLM